MPGEHATHGAAALAQTKWGCRADREDQAEELARSGQLVRTSVVEELAQPPLLLALLAKLAIFHERLERIRFDVLGLIVSGNLPTSEVVCNVRHNYDGPSQGWVAARARTW